ncbi:MAG: hypothetical protein IJI73_01135 [Kiritimatiellae bacterium]|nr:hypothetical protein [Kiritimatiellia bacterium]
MKSSSVIVNSKLGALAASLCAAAFAPMAVCASAYEQGMTPEIVLMAGSTDGTTNTLAEAIDAYNTANGTSYDISAFNGGDLKGHAIVKDGDGTLVMDTAISGYAGPVIIKDGVLKCMCTEALGADTTDSHVYVRDGATFWCNRVVVDGVNDKGKTVKMDGVFNLNRNLHVAGRGHNDQGALKILPVRPANVYNPTGLYGKTLYLDGDATVMHPAWAFLATHVYLNGHTLVVNSDTINLSGGGWCDATVQASSVDGPGKLVLEDSIYYLAGNSLNDNNTEGNELEIRDNSGFRFWQSSYSGYTWLFNFTGETAWLWGDNNDGTFFYSKYGEQKHNRIFNPMRLNGTTLKMRTQAGIPDNWVLLAGPVSGNGNICLEPESKTFPAGRLSLLNPENSFVGTATVDKGLLYVYGAGSLPPEVPVVVSRSHALDYRLQNSKWVLDYFGVEFVSPDVQTLSNLTFTSVEDAGMYHSGRIQGGSGTFSRIDKLSPNTMEYYSGIGSPLLNVEGGTVKLPRGPAPGLLEGTNVAVNVSDLPANNQGSNWHATFTARAASADLVALGPNVMNMLVKQHYGAPNSNAKVATYSGYIWNRTGENAVWTFAVAIGQYARVYIDGSMAIDYSYVSNDNHVDPAYKFVPVALTPGPHEIQVRACCGSVRGDNVTWPKNFGFVFDRQGREVPEDLTDYSAYTNNFELVLDPGDGSLFTRSIDEADLPHFDEMRFAEGATLDLNGNAYVASTISGWPTVVSTAADASAAPSLTITNSFVVNAADIVADPARRLSLSVPLSFGETGGVTVTNLAALTSGSYTIAEISGEGSLITTSGHATMAKRCSFDSSKWAVVISDDGRSLILKPAPGFKVSVR